MDFKLERTDGTPADPPTYRTGVYAWCARRHDPARRNPDASGRGGSSRRSRSAGGAGR